MSLGHHTHTVYANQILYTAGDVSYTNYVIYTIIAMMSCHE